MKCPLVFNLQFVPWLFQNTHKVDRERVTGKLLLLEKNKEAFLKENNSVILNNTQVLVMKLYREIFTILESMNLAYGLFLIN